MPSPIGAFLHRVVHADETKGRVQSTFSAYQFKVYQYTFVGKHGVGSMIVPGLFRGFYVRFYGACVCVTWISVLGGASFRRYWD